MDACKGKIRRNPPSRKGNSIDTSFFHVEHGRKRTWPFWCCLHFHVFQDRSSPLNSFSTVSFVFPLGCYLLVDMGKKRKKPSHTPRRKRISASISQSRKPKKGKSLSKNTNSPEERIVPKEIKNEVEEEDEDEMSQSLTLLHLNLPVPVGQGNLQDKITRVDSMVQKDQIEFIVREYSDSGPNYNLGIIPLSMQEIATTHWPSRFKKENVKFVEFVDPDLQKCDEYFKVLLPFCEKCVNCCQEFEESSGINQPCLINLLGHWYTERNLAEVDLKFQDVLQIPDNIYHDALLVCPQEIQNQLLHHNLQSFPDFLNRAQQYLISQSKHIDLTGLCFLIPWESVIPQVILRNTFSSLMETKMENSKEMFNLYFYDIFARQSTNKLLLRPRLAQMVANWVIFQNVWLQLLGTY